MSEAYINKFNSIFQTTSLTTWFTWIPEVTRLRGKEREGDCTGGRPSRVGMSWCCCRLFRCFICKAPGGKEALIQTYLLPSRKPFQSSLIGRLDEFGSTPSIPIESILSSRRVEEGGDEGGRKSCQFMLFIHSHHEERRKEGSFTSYIQRNKIQWTSLCDRVERMLLKWQSFLHDVKDICFLSDTDIRCWC